MNLYAYGLQSEIPLTALEVEIAAFKANDPRGLGKVEHFWNIVTMLWGPNNKVKSFERNPWTDRMAAGACENQYLGLNGCAACVAGHTRILNPVTGEQPTIKSLCDNRIRPVVMTLNGPAMAEIPFVKGFEELYEVVTERGQQFRATASHLVRTSEGFVPVSSLLPGSRLLSYEPARRKSILGTDLLVRGRDVLRSQRKVAGFLEDCFACSCPDGEQLLPALSIAQSSSPSPACAQECMAYVCGHSDGPDNKYSHTHLCRDGVHHSSWQPLDRKASTEICDLIPPESKSPSHEFRLSLQLLPSLSDFHLLSSLPEQDLGFGRKPTDVCVESSCAQYVVTQVAVQAIRSTGKALFYDMQVPGPNHYFAEGAVHHNSGKTEFAAVWAIVNWMCAPDKTLVFCTSTSLKESNRRIWGRIKAFWQAAPPMPGRLVDSMYIIRTDNGTGTFSDEQGIACIAGEKKNEKEAIGKMIGAHPERLILIVDEMPEITEAVLAAALSNMAINPFFQMLGIGNFKSMFDSFGVFVRPKGGYTTISAEDEEWDTELGLCLRFDGMMSPNITGGKDRYLCYDSKNLATHRKNYGPDSAEFWRMCRSFPCPEGEEHVLFSEVDFIRGDVHTHAIWLDPPVPVIAADPAFTTDGDKFAVVTGLYGKNLTGLPTLMFTDFKYLHESIALTKAGEPRDVQTARQLSELARDNKCPPENVGVDCSGPGGLAFGSILSAVWSSRYIPVKFGERPSQRLVSEDDPKTCEEAFQNRVTELWAIGRHFMRAGQIKGLPQEIAKELKSRHYETVKGVQMKMKVESKRDMKGRIGFSPDLGDAAMILLEVCRERFGFTPGSMNGLPKVQRKKDWIARVIKAHSVYDPQSAYTEPAYVATS